MASGEITAPYSKIKIAPEDFNHAAWSNAQPIHITHRWSGEEAPASQHTEARILWSEDSLLVRFVGCQIGPPIINPAPQLNRKTIGLWHRDVCEIFIAPNPESPHRYFEFEAAPNGEWIDLGIQLEPAGRTTDWELQSGMTTAARVSNDELTIVIRIPWSQSIPKPKKGDRWRVNLFRCVGTGNERYLAWRPTQTEEPNFHVPEAFGQLKFV